MMSEGGSKKMRLAALNDEINAELDEWHKNGVDPGMWRMGADELMFRCEILTLTKIVAEKLGLDQDDLDLVLKETVLAQMQKLRPEAIEIKSKQVKDQIMRGIKI